MVAATKFLQFHSKNRAKTPTVVADPTRESLSEALVKIGASKDEAAFALVYSHFAGRIKSFLIGKGMDEDTSEELMQEIMLTVWRRAESYDPAKAAASTWIFTIARNRRIDHLRGSWRVEVELDDVMLEHSLDHALVLLSGPITWRYRSMAGSASRYREIKDKTGIAKHPWKHAGCRKH